MKPMRAFQVCYATGEKTELYTFRAASALDARRAFEMVMIPGVRVLSVEPVEDSGDSEAPTPKPSAPNPPSPLSSAAKLNPARGKL